MTAEMTTKDLLTRITSCMYLKLDECACEQEIERYRVKQWRLALLMVAGQGRGRAEVERLRSVEAAKHDEVNMVISHEYGVQVHLTLGANLQAIADDPVRLARFMAESDGKPAETEDGKP